MKVNVNYGRATFNGRLAHWNRYESTNPFGFLRFGIPIGTVVIDVFTFPDDEGGQLIEYHRKNDELKHNAAVFGLRKGRRKIFGLEKRKKLFKNEEEWKKQASMEERLIRVPSSEKHVSYEPKDEIVHFYDNSSINDYNYPGKREFLLTSKLRYLIPKGKKVDIRKILGISDQV